MAQDLAMRRIGGKTAVDLYGAPIPGEMQMMARACHPAPVIVSMEHGRGMVELRTAADFELRYGRLLRSTCEYHGVERTVCAQSLPSAQRTSYQRCNGYQFQYGWDIRRCEHGLRSMSSEHLPMSRGTLAGTAVRPLLRSWRSGVAHYCGVV